MKTVAEASTGFVYCVSSVGITGERAQLRDDLADVVARVRRGRRSPWPWVSASRPRAGRRGRQDRRGSGRGLCRGPAPEGPRRTSRVRRRRSRRRFTTPHGTRTCRARPNGAPGTSDSEWVLRAVVTAEAVVARRRSREQRRVARRRGSDGVVGAGAVLGLAATRHRCCLNAAATQAARAASATCALASRHVRYGGRALRARRSGCVSDSPTSGTARRGPCPA